MKSFFDLKEQTIPGKTVVFTFGRFQPPTRGHQLVFDTVKNHAEKIGAEHRIYFSRTDPSVLATSKESFEKRAQRATQNPLTPDTKHTILKKLFPSHNFVAHPDIKTALHVLKHLSDDGVEHAIFVGDAEREELANQMQKYAGHPDFPNIKKVSYVKSGDRDPDADGIEGISGTKARAAAVSGDHDAFHAMMPEGTHPDTSREIMGMVRHSIARTNIAVQQEKSKPKTRKTVKEEEDLDLGELLLEKVKDKTRKERDHRMYGWGKSKPTPRQLANRKKKDKRTAARRKANESGRTRKGDKSVELDHKNGNANDNSSDNLRVISRHTNRSRNNNKWRK